MALLVVVVLIASGCVSYDAMVNLWGRSMTLGKPAAFLDFLSWLNTSGLAIIIVTC